MLKAVAFQTVIAWFLATMVYQIGSRIENGTLNLANILVIGAILLAVIAVITNKKNEDECSACPYCRSCNKK